MTDLDTIATCIADLAHQLGIPQYDLSGSLVDETSVQVDHGDPKQVKAAQRAGIMVRVWNQEGTLGVTSTSDLDPQGLKLALETAWEASFWGAKQHVPDFSPQDRDPIAEVDQPLVPLDPAGVLIEKLAAAEQALLGSHPAIAQVPYNGLGQRQFQRFYLNSRGSRRRQQGCLTSMYLYTTTRQEHRKTRSAGAYRWSRDLEHLDIEGCIAEARDKTLSHLDYRPIASGRYPVVFSPEAFLSLLAAFSNLFNAQKILDQQSLSTPESLGSQVASPLLNLVDDPLHPQRINPDTFDGEGTPTRRLPLIENGILTHFLHSAGTAKRMHTQPTGHANLGAKVTVSPHYFHVLPAPNPDPRYDLSRADGVVWIDDLKALHAGVKALQGSFSLPFDGWLVKEGKPISIEAATVAGDFRELLQQIVHVDGVAKVTSGGICPQIWVEGLSITGEGS
ncbi:MAG: TldD/PmbA family protein [Thermostichales cyanobacterium SRBZ-1_bins_19]